MDIIVIIVIIPIHRWGNQNLRVKILTYNCTVNEKGSIQIQMSDAAPTFTHHTNSEPLSNKSNAVPMSKNKLKAVSKG